jgi:5-methylcytosine-specific restriction endonuclease McrA
MLKTCTHCNQAKPPGEFPRQRSLKSGLSSWCRQCHQKRNRNFYIENKKVLKIKVLRPPYQKISAEEWARRRAARAEHTLLDKEESRRELVRIDVEQIMVEGVELRRTRHKICPVIQHTPELYAVIKSDRKREQEKEWASKNRPRLAALARNRYATSEKLKEDNRARRRVRRARMANVSVDLTAHQWKAIKVAYRNRCAYCRRKRPLTQDHLIPISKGGEHTASNIIPACRPCNSRKGAGAPRVVFQPHIIC